MVFPAFATALQGKATSADAVVIATPEYNDPVLGVLRSAIDWSPHEEPQPFRDKPFIIANPGVIGMARARCDLRKALCTGRVLGVRVLEQAGGDDRRRPTRFDAEGRLTDKATGKFLHAI